MKKFDADTKVVAGIVPIDLSGGAKNGDWVSLSDYDSLTVVYVTDVGTAGQDATIKLQQSTTNAGAGPVKDVVAGQWYVVQGAALDDDFETDGTPGSFEDDGETMCIARIEITADQLDLANGYAFVRVHASNPGATAGKFGAAVYILRGARYVLAVDEQPSVQS